MMIITKTLIINSFQCGCSTCIFKQPNLEKTFFRTKNCSELFAELFSEVFSALFSAVNSEVFSGLLSEPLQNTVCSKGLIVTYHNVVLVD